jgi:hypothetical protein
LTILSAEAGFFTKTRAARVGRRVRSPPQFGQTPRRTFRAQSAQNVHSNEQIKASSDCGAKFFPQHSQNCRISNIFLFSPLFRVPPSSGIAFKTSAFLFETKSRLKAELKTLLYDFMQNRYYEKSQFLTKYTDQF